MKVLFLTDTIFPVPTSNGACVEKIAKEYENAYIMSVSDSQGKQEGNVFSYYYKRKPSRLYKRVFGFCEDSEYVDFLTDKAVRLIEEYKIDTVVCVYQPVENLIAGIKIKEKCMSVVVISYLLDCIGEYDYSNIFKKKIITFNLIRLIKKFNVKCDGIIALKYYADFFKSHKIGGIDYTGIPNLLSVRITDVPVKYDTMIYTGSFNESFRNPKNVLELINKLNITLRLYSKGCEKIVDEYVAKNGKIIKHDLVASSEVGSIINSGAFLLNVSNTLKHAVPGKLLEYIASGYPIINYIFNKENDPAIDDCLKYPNMLILFDGDNDNEEKLKAFINKNFQRVNFEYLYKQYYDSTPEFVAQKIKTIYSERGYVKLSNLS